MSMTFNDLPVEVISTIFKHTDFVSRMQLKLCNRMISAIVDRVEMDLDEVHLVAQDKPGPEKLELMIDNVTWKQMGSRNVELKYHGRRKMIILADPRATLLSIFQKIVINRTTRIQDIKIIAEFPPEYERYSNLVKANEIHVFGMQWLNLFVPRCNSIRVADHPATVSNTLEVPWTPLFSDANSIHVIVPCNITDTQLINSNWHRMKFLETEITANGLNMMIRKWINENYGKGCGIQIYKRRGYQWRTIVDGLFYKKRILLDGDEEPVDEGIHIEIKMRNQPFVVLLWSFDRDAWNISIQDKTADDQEEVCITELPTM